MPKEPRSIVDESLTREYKVQVTTLLNNEGKSHNIYKITEEEAQRLDSYGDWTEFADVLGVEPFEIAVVSERAIQL